jgi:hypothetical protein
MIDTKQFEQDTETSKRLVDDLSAAALGLVNGGAMGYSSFIQIRDEFKQHIEEVAKSYKTVEIE